MKAAPRRLEYVPLDELAPATRNAKTHDQAGIGRSVGRFGFMDLPVLDERTGRLVAGHGRRQDLLDRRERGEDPPDGVEVRRDGTWLVPVVRGWASRSDEEADGAALALNRLTEAGGWSEPVLAEILGGLAQQDMELVAAAGFDAGLVESILAQASPTVEHGQVPDSDADYGEDPETEAARQDKVAGQTPLYAQGLAEMILVYPEAERAEVGRLVAAAREVWGADTKASVVVLRALRLAATAGWPEPARPGAEVAG